MSTLDVMSGSGLDGQEAHHTPAQVKGLRENLPPVEKSQTILVWRECTWLIPSTFLSLGELCGYKSSLFQAKESDLCLSLCAEGISFSAQRDRVPPMP